VINTLLAAGASPQVRAVALRMRELSAALGLAELTAQLDGLLARVW
jgi:hypothetical protein